MSAIPQILVTSLTVGAMYALAALGLSLTWGTLRMLNMAHGAMLALGGYVAYSAYTKLGFPGPLAFAAAAVAGGAFGWLLYLLVVRRMLDAPGYETNVIIATVGLGIILENGILHVYGGQPYGQPVKVSGRMDFFDVAFPLQNIMIIILAIAVVTLVQCMLSYSRFGRAVRACMQQRDAAQLVGIPVRRIFGYSLAIAGMLTAMSGVMLSSITQLSPLLGADPMLKAFIMCVLAGLGNVGGSVIAAFALALLEISAQHLFGARWGFPVLLLTVVLVLIWRPYGLFSRNDLR